LFAPSHSQVYGDSVYALAYYCKNGCDKTCSYSITTGSFHDFRPDGVTRELNETDCWDANKSFERDGYTEFVTVKLETMVHITGVEIGENRGGGSVVGVEVRASERERNEAKRVHASPTWKRASEASKSF